MSLLITTFKPGELQKHEEKVITINQSESSNGGNLQQMGAKKSMSSSVFRGLAESCYNPQDGRAIDTRVNGLLVYMFFMSSVGLHLVGAVWAVVLCLIWSLFGHITLSFIKYQDQQGRQNSVITGFSRAVLMGIFSLSILFFYMGTHTTIHNMNRQLWDEKLLELDTFLLGAFFPAGQLGLWLDNNGWIGPTSILGHIAVELLQWLYVSFFFWCSALLVYAGLYEYFILGFFSSIQVQRKSDEPLEKDIEADQDISKKSPRGIYSIWSKRTEFRHNEEVWRKLQILQCCIVGAFLLNFTISFIFPAVSPRVYLASRYQNPLHGLWFGDELRAMMQKSDEGSYGSFPSGHVALSWVPAIAALKLGYQKYGKACSLAAFLITFSTIYLRYHYFVDVLSSVFLIAFGLYYGKMWSLRGWVQPF